jgi:hypothetical protein
MNAKRGNKLNEEMIRLESAKKSKNDRILETRKEINRLLVKQRSLGRGWESQKKKMGINMQIAFLREQLI